MTNRRNGPDPGSNPHSGDDRKEGDVVFIRGLPAEQPTALFPVIELECAGTPQASDWAVDRLWGGDPGRMSDWAQARGSSVWADGAERG